MLNHTTNMVLMQGNKKTNVGREEIPNTKNCTKK